MEVQQIQGKRYVAKYHITQDAYSVNVFSIDNIKYKLTGIYDGHGRMGHHVSRQVANELPALIISRLEQSRENLNIHIPSLFHRYAISQINNEWWQESGTTACLVLETPSLLYIFNTGDSNVIYQEKGFNLRTNVVGVKEDRFRLARYKNITIAKGRINGRLNLSRSFGNFSFSYLDKRKEGDFVISPIPTFTVVDKSDLTVPYYVMVSDGVTDVLSNEEVINAAANGQVANLAQLKGSLDDLTVLTIPLSSFLGTSFSASSKNVEEEKEEEEEVANVLVNVGIKALEDWVFTNLSFSQEPDGQPESIYQQMDNYIIERYRIPANLEINVTFPTDNYVVVVNLGDTINIGDKEVMYEETTEPLRKPVSVVGSGKSQMYTFVVYHY